MSNRKHTVYIQVPETIRIGQQIFNFLEWLRTDKGYQAQGEDSRMADPFYISDEEWDKLYNEFLCL